jgi:uncharacterized protein
MSRLHAWMLGFALALAGLIGGMPGAAAQSDMLYRGEAIVTGQLMPERLRGFGLGAEEVLIKLTGDPALAATPEGRSVIAKAPEMVAEHSYEDRMKDIPVHDEQGTRDRPYFLRMLFDPAKFDAALAGAGIEAWQGERPKVAIWLGIRDARGTYIVTRTANQGYEQREVLKEASRRRAVPIVLPEEGQTAVAYHDIEQGERGKLQEASEPSGTACILYGVLEFDGQSHWNVGWHAFGNGIDAQWRMTGVTFDRALKGAIDEIMTASARQARQSRGK